MAKLIRFVMYFLAFLLLAIAVVSFTSYDYLIKGVWATYLQGDKSATINDKQYFNTKLIRAEAPWEWPGKSKDRYAPSDHLDSIIHTTHTAAYAVFYRDSLQYEYYGTNYNRLSRTNSFSMAKSVTVMLAQIAIENQSIKSWDQKVLDFLPELNGEYAKDLSLWDLAIMKSGLNWDENYSHAFGITAKTYYGSDVYALMMDEVPVNSPPGAEFEYQSGATQLLGMAVERATGRSLADLASEYLWTPMGANDDAEWNVDGSGEILSFCCINSNVLDFARLGHILLHDGYWNQHYFLDSAFVRAMQEPIGSDYYGISLWLGQVDGLRFSYLRGNLGQYVILVPEYELIIARLGEAVGSYVPGTTVSTLVSESVRHYTDLIEHNRQMQ